jgi:hypothetical protein
MLNLIMFGKTAKEWKEQNKDLEKKGLNLRDEANIEDLIVLSGLETLNAYLLDQKITKVERIKLLITEAKKNFERIKNTKSVLDIKKLTNK